MIPPSDRPPQMIPVPHAKSWRLQGPKSVSAPDALPPLGRALPRRAADQTRRPDASQKGSPASAPCPNRAGPHKRRRAGGGPRKLRRAGLALEDLAPVPREVVGVRPPLLPLWRPRRGAVVPQQRVPEAPAPVG